MYTYTIHIIYMPVYDTCFIEVGKKNDNYYEDTVQCTSNKWQSLLKDNL